MVNILVSVLTAQFRTKTIQEKLQDVPQTTQELHVLVQQLLNARRTSARVTTCLCVLNARSGTFRIDPLLLVAANYPLAELLVREQQSYHVNLESVKLHSQINALNAKFPTKMILGKQTDVLWTLLGPGAKEVHKLNAH